MGRRLCIASSALVIAGSCAPTALGDEAFPSDGTVRDLAATDGRVVWERDTPTGQRLRERLKGVSRDLPLRPAINFAGVDLGRDSRGRLVAVYSRCPRKQWGCDLFSYSFSSRREVKLSSASRRRCDEFGPSIDSGVIAFGRGPRGRGRRALCKGGLYAMSMRPGSRPRRSTSLVPRALNLRRNRVVFSTRAHFSDECCLADGLYLARLGRRSRITGRRALPPPCSDDPCKSAGAYTNPELDSSHVYWSYDPDDYSDPGGLSRPPNELLRSHVQGGRPERARDASGATVFTLDRGSLIYANGSGVIQVVANPVFTRFDPAPGFF